MAVSGARRRDRELEAWVTEGIITPQQADRIRAHRGRSSGGPGAFALLASIGGLCIALGVILVIAYNWDRLHRGWKLGGFLIALAAVAEAAGRLPDRMSMARSAVRTCWLLLPLAGIGLMGQVYQLSGDPLKPLLLALALGAPLVRYADVPMVSLLHTFGLGAAAWVGAHNADTWLSLAFPRDEDALSPAGHLGIPLLGLSLLWLAAGWQANATLGPTSKRWLLAGFLLFLWSLATESTGFRVHTIGAQFFVIGALLAVFQGTRGLLRLDDEETDYWAAGLTFAALYAATFLWHVQAKALDGQPETLGLMYAGILATTGTVFMFLGRPGIDGQPVYRTIPARLLTLAPLAIGGALTAGLGPRHAAVAANAAAIAFAIQQMSTGVARGRPAGVTLGILMLGAIIVTRFLDYFGTMLQSGMAFIVTGLAFIGLAWALHRGRTALIARMRETP